MGALIYIYIYKELECNINKRHEEIKKLFKG